MAAPATLLAVEVGVARGVRAPSNLACCEVWFIVLHVFVSGGEGAFAIVVFVQGGECWC
jgi:hypothetical protein